MEALERAFTRMGARVAFAEFIRRRTVGGVVSNDLALDVREDKRGEYFLVSRASGSDTELVVLDVQPADRHLLLLSRNGKEKHRFLLGHDERHWFVAGIPESTPVSRVRDAKRALKPVAVQTRERGLRTKERERRSNAAWVRQGEWFFVPAPNVRAKKLLVLRNEPLMRGVGSKPHICEEMYRAGGQTVYVSSGYPKVLTQAQFEALSEATRKKHGWRVMRRDMQVYVRGHVRHVDHKTVFLDGWHEVLMNTENQSDAMRNVAFLD